MFVEWVSASVLQCFSAFYGSQPDRRFVQDRSASEIPPVCDCRARGDARQPGIVETNTIQDLRMHRGAIAGFRGL